MTQIVYSFTEWLSHSWGRELLSLLIVAIIAFPYFRTEDNSPFPNLISYIVVLIISLSCIFFNPVSSKIILDVIYFGYAIPSLIFTILASIVAYFKDLNIEEVAIYTFLYIWTLSIVMIVFRNLDNPSGLIASYKTTFISYWFDLAMISSGFYGLGFFLYYNGSTKKSFDFMKILKFIPIISFIITVLICYDLTVKSETPVFLIGGILCLLVIITAMQFYHREKREPCMSDNYRLLFKKALKKDKYSSTQKNAIELLTKKYPGKFKKPNQKLLKKIVLKSDDTSIRIKAIETINNRAFLEKIANNEKVYQVRCAAYKRLGSENNTEVLIDMAKNEDSPSVYKTVLQKINDDKILFDISKSAKILEVRELAVGKLSNPELLLDIAKNNHDIFVRCAAIEKITDQNVLADLAKNAKETEIRFFAIAKISNAEILSGLVKNDPLSKIRIAAIEKLTDTGLLSDVFIADNDANVRQAAILRTLVLFASNKNVKNKKNLTQILQYLLGLTEKTKSKFIPFPILIPYAEEMAEELVFELQSKDEEKRKLIKKILIGASRQDKNETLKGKLSRLMTELEPEVQTSLKEVFERWGDSKIPKSIDIHTKNGVVIDWAW
jgi:hypothetical protein